MSRDDELDGMIDRALAEVVAHPDEDTIDKVMQRFWDSELERGITRSTLDALAFTGFAVLVRERLGGVT